MKILAVLCGTISGLVIAGAAFATCPGGTALPPMAGKPVFVAQDALFFAVAELQLDHDGSPEAYGVRDQGLENICNGLAPLQPPQCRGKNQGACFTACQSAFADWSRGGANLATLPSSMCSIGLGGGGCSRPQVRLQDPPRQDWFVSETSVHVSPPAGMHPSQWTAAQAAQLDPAKVPYFVIPAGLRGLPWDATPGDAGIAIDAKTGHQAAFVVGDSGGALDEASTALHTALRGGTPPPKGPRRSALGETVQSYLSGSSGDFRIAIFRHSTARIGTTSTLSQTADTLPAWIADTAKTRLAAIGGTGRVIACSQP